ncbi:MAG: hypothetical protein FJY55_13705 [Betaproteobacteria bacterium]|nr:hypothetical protein [Betaproteobacteria bacterium]
MQSPERKLERFGSYLEAVEAFLDEPWSDGMPVIPPTPGLVETMVAAGSRGMDECLGSVPRRELSVYTWQAATCAVMAGCRPDYFPVVLATWEAMLDPRFSLHTVLSSTGGAAIAAVVSGPYAEKIGMRSGMGVFGPGNRANATIGRAVRLGAFTALKAITGELDASSFGHAGKYTFHFAEGDSPMCGGSPWPTIREQMGFDRAATTVTVMPAEAPRQIMHRFEPKAEDMLKAVGLTMRDPAQNGTGTDTCCMVVLGPEHASIFADAGMSPGDVRRALALRSRTSIRELAAAGFRHDYPGNRYNKPDADGSIAGASASHILVVPSGGPGAGWSAFVPSWSWIDDGHPVTRPVRLPEQPEPLRDMARAERDLDFA